MNYKDAITEVTLKLLQNNLNEDYKKNNNVDEMQKIEVYYHKTNGLNEIVFVNKQDNNFKVYDEDNFWRNEGFDLYVEDDEEKEELIKKLQKWVKNTEFDSYYSMLGGADAYDNMDELEDGELIKIGEYED